MPLPGTRVVPTGWSKHHAPTAAGGMYARCRIYDPALDTRGWNEETESVTLQRGAPVYDGPCRIQAVQSAGQALQADEAVTHRDYLVQLVMDAPHLEDGWPVEPYDVVNDGELEQAQLLIVETQLGSERFTRDLICSHNQN